MNNKKNTPMMEQYLSIKRNYTDTILLYRMGDFYEMFFEDACLASQLLEIVLTSRNRNETKPVPMCGFPHRSASSYIAKLIGNGHKVAICDQISIASKGKGLVERKVVRVITPGMIVDDNLLDGKTNNYILAFNFLETSFGLAFLDISTGSFYTTESRHASDIIDEIIRISPSEILLPKSLNNRAIVSNLKSRLFGTYISLVKNSFFDSEAAYKVLCNQFGASSFKKNDYNNIPVSVTTASALIQYVNKTQKQKLEHLKSIKIYSLNNFLVIDRQSRKNLELFDGIRSELQEKSLIDVLNKTTTSMGSRLLKDWMSYPLVDYDKIVQRYDAVSDAVNQIEVTQKTRQLMQSMFDLERLVGKVSIGNASPRDLNAIKVTIQMFPEFLKIVSYFKSDLYRINPALNKQLDQIYSLANLISKSIRNNPPIAVNEGGIIKEGFDLELDKILKTTKSAKEWIANLEVKERKLTSINSLKVKYNKIFGYYIEIPKVRRTKIIPQYYNLKQTLVNTERYTTDSLRQFELEILNAENQRISLELKILEKILTALKKSISKLQVISSFISVVDCLTNLAMISYENDYCRPILNLKGIINIEEARHPVVEKMVAGERFIPNSIEMDNTKNQVLIITGPNMAGKSTILRQTALCVIMAQMGCFVPAKKAVISITDRIFTRVGALDNLAAGQSTFMVEMQETANILNNSTCNSLVIVDEIGRGTSTLDGMSIGWAIIEYLHDLNGIGVKSMFATHYHELTEIEKHKSRVKNFNIPAKEVNENLIFIRKLFRGSTNKSYGIQVAALAGLPKKVILRAKEILLKLDNNSQHNSKILATSSLDKLKKHEEILNLLEKEQKIILKLKDIDILKMNPIDALNCLNELQIKARAIY